MKHSGRVNLVGIMKEPISWLNHADYGTLLFSTSFPGTRLCCSVIMACFTFREVMIIVQVAPKNRTVEEIGNSDLKPYQANTKDPYVTAYLKADVLPLTFVIGDGKEYNSEKETYFNQFLEHNSNYIVFLRFFESQVLYVFPLFCPLGAYFPLVRNWRL